MLKKYTSLYTGLNFITYLGFRLWSFADTWIASWLGFFICISALVLPICYLVFFTIAKDYKLRARFLTCIINIVISYVVFRFTQDTSFLDYNPISLSNGLGFALLYVFYIFYINVGVPVVMLLITIIKSIIYSVKRRKKDGGS